MSYADQLQRKLREQLNFRSASIEASGRLFRLVQRTSVENTMPSMTRQILTLDANQPLPITLLKTTWEKGKLTGISVESVVQPQFAGAGTAEKAGDMSGQYAVKATPVLLTAIRKIGNQKGVRTLGLDDDDRIQYDIHLDVKDPVTLTEVNVRRYTISFKLQGDPTQTLHRLSVRRYPTESPSAAVFESEVDAARFVAFLMAQIAKATSDDLVAGKILRDMPELNQEHMEVGYINAKGLSLERIDVTSIRPDYALLGATSEVQALPPPPTPANP
jgi:hypothetical protein